MNSRGGPPIWGCMLMNSRGGPPILRGSASRDNFYGSSGIWLKNKKSSVNFQPLNMIEYNKGFQDLMVLKNLPFLRARRPDIARCNGP